jgi:hypothetical protein
MKISKRFGQQVLQCSGRDLNFYRIPEYYFFIVNETHFFRQHCYRALLHLDPQVGRDLNRERKRNRNSCAKGTGAFQAVSGQEVIALTLAELLSA